MGGHGNAIVERLDSGVLNVTFERSQAWCASLIELTAYFSGAVAIGWPPSSAIWKGNSSGVGFIL